MVFGASLPAHARSWHIGPITRADGDGDAGANSDADGDGDGDGDGEGHAGDGDGAVMMLSGGGTR